MTRRLLINASHPEECRVAIVEGDKLMELEVERAQNIQLKGNIYKASIKRVEPSLQAAFLDIGSSRNGFLQINDIHPAYFKNWPKSTTNKRRPERPSIQDVLEANQELVVQVVKDERDLKGATLTTNLSIPGRYLVLMIGNQRGGVSRKINDEKQRNELRDSLSQLKVPAGMGLIVRTAGINKGVKELQNDLDMLVESFNKVVKGSMEPGSPRVLYQESDLTVRTIRDYLKGDIDEIIIDEQEAYDEASQFIERTMPQMASKVSLFDKKEPLFSHYQIEDQVSATGKPEVTLPSGGSIVISPTEAIVAIDVNSGRSTSGRGVEETAFDTNCEAATAVGQQLRLRDLGGLVVVDFIDMNDKKHRSVVEKTLKDAVKGDRAKVEVGRISKFGLLEMSRQRLKSSLASHTHQNCPYCAGQGNFKVPEVASLDVLRKIEAAVYGGGVKDVNVKMNPSAALFLLNNKRRSLAKLEDEAGAAVKIYADGRLRAEEFELMLDSVQEKSADKKQEVPEPKKRASKPRTRKPRRKPRDKKPNEDGAQAEKKEAKPVKKETKPKEKEAKPAEKPAAPVEASAS